MTKQRFEIRKQELLDDATIDPKIFKDILQRLKLFLLPFVKTFFNQKTKEHALTYLQGLLSDLKRKNTESIAYAHDQERAKLQHFLGASPWDYQPLLTELNLQVASSLGEKDAVITFDPSGHRKCGKDSVGVQRQWLGRLGKVENCQVGIYMGYASRNETALVDFRLYLPKDWAKDKLNREKCGVPKQIRYKTRHELAIEMLKERGPILPHAWIGGDDEMGRSSKFRAQLREMEEQYLLAVPSNSLIRDLEAEKPNYNGRGRKPEKKFERVSKWREQLEESEWSKVEVGNGEKGPFVIEIVKRRVLAKTEGGKIGEEELLVVIGSLEESGEKKYDYYLSNANPKTLLEEFGRVEKSEHRIEDCFKRAKSEAGLSDYEVRGWLGWHHHQILSLVATWFLVQETTLSGILWYSHRK